MSFEFEITKTCIPGVKIYTPSSFIDDRGMLWSSVTPDLHTKLDVKYPFLHVKYAKNKKNVLRGIHGDFESWKLVTALSGSIQQVVVDNREHSPTYQESLSWVLDSNNPKMVLIPPGVGNALKSLTDSLYVYSLAYPESYNDYDKQFTLPWNDPAFCIKWQGETPILSSRDK